MAPPRSILPFFLAVLLAVVLGAVPPAQVARGGDPLPLEVSWFMGPLQTECEGPLDESGISWHEEGFDMSFWEQVYPPYGEAMSGIADRFFRGLFTVEPVDGVIENVVLSFASDDGIDVFVNGQPVGSWGRGCHAPGCVNIQVCGIIDNADPVDISSYLMPGENVVAIHVTNCDCCCRMEFNAQIDSVGGGSPGGTSFLRGDTNQDGLLDLTDPISTLNCLFFGIPCSTCLDAEDSNDDGGIDVGDPTSTLIYLFLGGPVPASPGIDCGADPSEDFLPCDSFARCP